MFTILSSSLSLRTYTGKLERSAHISQKANPSMAARKKNTIQNKTLCALPRKKPLKC